MKPSLPLYYPPHSLFYPLVSGFDYHSNSEATSAEGKGDIHTTQSIMEFLDFDIHALYGSIIIGHTSFLTSPSFAPVTSHSTGSPPTSDDFFLVFSLQPTVCLYSLGLCPHLFSSIHSHFCLVIPSNS